MRMVKTVEKLCKHDPGLIERSGEKRVYLFQFFQRTFALGIVGLVGNQKEEVACRLQPGKRFESVGREHEIFRTSGRFVLPGCGIENIAVQYAITVQKYSAPSTYLVDSHFISFFLRPGWETIRCQTTAWNSSACAVTVSGVMVGITTQASATWAV